MGFCNEDWGKSYFGLNDKSREFILKQSIEMIDGTNCVIVQEDETNLYGMYDGSTLRLSYIQQYSARRRFVNIFCISLGGNYILYFQVHTINVTRKGMQVAYPVSFFHYFNSLLQF